MKTLLLLVLLGVLAAGLYYLFFRPTSVGCCSPSAPPSCSVAAPGLHYVATWLPSTAPRVLDEFFTRASLGGPHPYGLDRDGVLVQQARATDARVVVRDDSLNSPEALARWPLTYACGHAFYDSRPAFGRLRGSSWADHVAAAARVRVDATKLSPDSVLLLEGEAGGDGPSLVACLTGDLTAMGVVVRRNAALLVNDVDALWKVQFILVESGGLLQAGSNCRDSHRFRSRLRVQLVHPPGGYAAMPVVASQYSYRVYAPGVDFAKGAFEAFDGSGMCFTNGFGAKCICVGFNGNLHLAGAATAPVRYVGTWKASDPGGGDWLNGPEQTGGDGLFTYGSSLLPASYACVWARLRQGSGRKGDRTLQLHPDDLPPLAELRRAWPPGALLLVTCSSQQFTTADNPTGLLPFRFPDGAGTSMDADNATLAAKLKVEDRGVEVVTLDGVDEGGALRLRQPLAFDHSLRWVQLSNDRHATKSISVQVHHHVGLLSRSITVEGVATSGGAGCNVLASGSMAAAMASGVENSGPGAPPGDAIAGSGGAVDVNYYRAAGNSEITKACYGARTPDRWREFYGVKGAKPSTDLKGSWLMGTAGLTGCNSLLGGHCMFRNGSSVLLDAVELVRMGVAPNFGKLGQYALHFHLTGFAEAFRGYLRDRAHPRDGLVQNCSIWRSYSRFVTLHGACGVTVRNNVCFLGYGHGFFIEDGTELANVFDHNLSVASLVCCSNGYWNPSGVYGNVATDYCPVGMMWLKNNLNVVARSVFCCSPGNTIALWYVPQPISRLRGPSAVAFGSQELQLPHCGSLEAITTTGLSSQGNTNFQKVAPSEATMVCRDLSSGAAVSCSCWRPADRGLLDFAYTDLRTGCSSYTSDNALHPLQLCAENVGYCLAGFWSEFPEELSDRMQNNDPENAPPSRPDTTFADYPVGMAINCGLELQDGEPATMWLPTDGQNSCTDTIVSTYPPTRWLPPWNRGPSEDAFTAYVPMSAATLNTAVDGCETAQADGVFATPLPKILAACLTFNLGANGALWGASGWMKGSPGMLLNCALLETSFRTAGRGDVAMTEMHPDGSRPATQPSYTSTSFNISYQDNNKLFAQWYVVVHNHLTNGAFPFQTNPTVLSGSRTYADAPFSYAWASNEYSNDPTGVVVALPNVFVFDLDFETVLRDVVEGSKNAGVVVASPLQIFDAKTMKRYSVVKGQPKSRQELGVWQFPAGGAWPGSPVKFPFLCGGSQDDYGLLRTRSVDAREGERPEWGGIVANALLRSFTAPQAVVLGDLVCKNLARTWKNVPPLPPTTPPPSGGWKPASPIKTTPQCSAPPPFIAPASAP